MGLADSKHAPYAPVDAVSAVIDTHRDRTLHEPVTVEVLMRCGVTESLAPRTLKSLKLLDLVGPDGSITPTFEKFKHTPTEQYPDVLTAWLRDVYKPVFDFVDPTSDDPQRIIDQFRSYEPSGQRNRMVSLFLGLCVKAGLLDKEPPMPRGGKSHARRRVSTTNKATANNKSEAPRPPSPGQQEPQHMSDDDTYLVTLRSGGRVGLTVSVDLFKLNEHDRTFVFDLVDKIKSYTDQEDAP